MRKLSVTYSSWPLDWLREEEQLATLAVFYDEVWLPYPYGIDPDALVLWKSEGVWPRPIHQHVFEAYAEWKAARRPLLDTGVIHFLPPLSTETIHGSQFLSEFRNRQAVANPQSARLEGNVLTDTWSIISGAAAFAASALVEKPAPELFVAASAERSSDQLAGLLVDSLFRIELPLLQNLTAEQILEVRDYLNDTKEGFRDLIFGLSDDFEARVEHGMTEAVAARKTVERKLLPKYHEFRRQLAARDQGFWAEVLSRVGKFLQVDASPWTPKFYGAMLELFLGSYSKAADADREELTTEHQAYQYLATLEKRTNRSGQD